MSKSLRVLAFTGPHWPIRPQGVSIRSFTAGTPFSLQNALREAAGRAVAKQGAWADSNWATLEGRRASVLLLEFMDEARPIVEAQLSALRPNLVLIGAMTLGFPGAIELARLVRRHRGSDCLVVLGGKHANETLRRRANGAPLLLPNSPLELMRSGRLPGESELPLFDVVVSGEGESLTVALGEAVAAAEEAGAPAAAALAFAPALQQTPGTWAFGAVSGDQIQTVTSVGPALNFDRIPTAPRVFGLQSAFPIFGGAPTGHAYSDMGLGCRMNCFFCSEKVSLNGKLRRGPRVVDRLMEHLVDIWVAGGEGAGGDVGAFVEDSILLGGDTNLIATFAKEWRRERPGRLSIGCQMTAFDVRRLKQTGLLTELRHAGVSYVAIGMETVSEEVADRMSKHRRGDLLWSEVNRLALSNLGVEGIRAGVYVLWGLGEPQNLRLRQLQQLAAWADQDACGQPCAVGLNWATLHPAGNGDECTGAARWPELDRSGRGNAEPLPDFTRWGTEPTSERLPYFVELFGEASETYPYYRGVVPSIAELRALKQAFDAWDDRNR